MTLTSKYTSLGLPWVIPGGALLLVAAVTHFSLVHAPEAFFAGVTVDLLLIIPLLHFWLMRRQQASGITAITWFVLGIGVASLVLPSAQQSYLSAAKTWVVPVVELFVLGMVTYKVRQLRAQYRHKKKQNDFYSTLCEATATVLPAPVAIVLASEVATLYYGFFRGKSPALRAHEFSYHQNNGSVALWATVLFLVVAETAVVHLLLARWNIVVAWVVTALSIYTALQIWGIIRSMYHRPIVADEHLLRLRYGYISEANIPWNEIASVTLTISTDDTSIPSLSPLGTLEPTNVLIGFKCPQTVFGLYGSRKVVSTLALYTDEPHRLVALLNLRLNEGHRT